MACKPVICPHCGERIARQMFSAFSFQNCFAFFSLKSVGATARHTQKKVANRYQQTSLRKKYGLKRATLKMLRAKYGKPNRGLNIKLKIQPCTDLHRRRLLPGLVLTACGPASPQSKPGRLTCLQWCTTTPTH